MNGWRWELRRKGDGLVVDRAMSFAVLLRASGPAIELNLGRHQKGRYYVAVHVASGKTVAERAGERYTWRVDRELLRELEAAEA